MRIGRREFGRQLAVAALAGAGVSNAAISREEQGKQPVRISDIPIVDTHQHLWDLERFRPPWLGGAPDVLRQSHVTKDYLAATKDLHVVQAVYMEVDVAPEDQTAEAEHVISLAKSDEHPTVAAVISGRPARKSFEAYIRRFAKSPYIKGVRQVLHVPETPRGYCLDEQFVRSMKLLGELDLSFDLCMRPSELADGAALAKKCSATRFILDHCGNADPKAFLPEGKRGAGESWHEEARWKRDMAALAELDNVICKISGIVARAPEGWSTETLAPIVEFCLEAFGPDRVVFGGDWPVCKLGAPLREWVRALDEIVASRGREEQEKLYHRNARRFYSLEGTESAE